MSISQYGVNSRIIKLIIGATGTYDNLYNRPYEPIATANTIDKLTNEIHSNNSLKNCLSNVASEIISPSSDPEFVAYIPNGWNERRCRFYMQVISTDQTGFKSYIEHIVGYTNYFGVSMLNGYDKHLDPKMEFIINNIAVIAMDNVQDHMTGLPGTKFQAFDNFNLITNSDPNKETKVLKPGNVLASIEFQNYAMPENTINYTNIANNRISTASSSLNNSPVEWVNRTLGSFIRAARDEVTDTDPHKNNHSDFDEDYFTGYGGLDAGPITKAIHTYIGDKDELNYSYFKEFLNRRVSNYIPMSDNKFLYEELFVFNKGPFKIEIASMSESSSLHKQGQSTDWSGSDIITQNAHLIAQTFPNLMLKNSLRQVSVSFTNRTIDGKIVYTSLGIASLVDGDPIAQVRFESFIDNYIHLYISKILDFTKCSAELIITCSILGDITIQFSNYQGGIGSIPYIVYTCPNFANSTFSNVITKSNEKYDSIVNEIKTISTNIEDVIKDKYQRYNTNSISSFNGTYENASSINNLSYTGNQYCINNTGI